MGRFIFYFASQAYYDEARNAFPEKGVRDYGDLIHKYNIPVTWLTNGEGAAREDSQGWGGAENGRRHLRIPIFVKLAVTKADPGVRGDTVSGATKPVVLETGVSIQVPLFIERGEILKIDTRTDQYVERA